MPPLLCHLPPPHPHTPSALPRLRRPIISPRSKRPSSWTGWDWNPSPWYGCPCCTEWLLRRPPSIRPSATSARSVRSLDSGIGNPPGCHSLFPISLRALVRLHLLPPVPVAVCSSSKWDRRWWEGGSITPVTPRSLGYFGACGSLGRCPFPASLFSCAESQCRVDRTVHLSVSTKILVCQRYTSSFREPKHFDHVSFLSRSFLFIESVQELVRKLRNDPILGEPSWYRSLLYTLHDFSCKVIRLVLSTDRISLSVNVIMLFT